jgi:hypothetical protein
VIFFGKGGDIANNRREEQELSVLCLRVLQAALVSVKTLMVQDILADDELAARLIDAARRGLTPLFWTHVVPYLNIYDLEYMQVMTELFVEAATR